MSTRFVRRGISASKLPLGFDVRPLTRGAAAARGNGARQSAPTPGPQLSLGGESGWGVVVLVVVGGCQMTSAQQINASVISVADYAVYVRVREMVLPVAFAASPKMKRGTCLHNG